jgi:hypothetical protein
MKRVSLFATTMLVALFSSSIGFTAMPDQPRRDSDRPLHVSDTSRVLNHLLDQVIRKQGRRCPAGQNRDPNTGVCFSCSHNDHFENGRCVPCRSGFHAEGDRCVSDKKTKKRNGVADCGQGMEFRNGRCRPTRSSQDRKSSDNTEFPPVEQCPEGQNPDPKTGVCFSCSHNDHFENGKCVPCMQGFHVEGDECVAD